MDAGRVRMPGAQGAQLAFDLRPLAGTNVGSQFHAQHGHLSAVVRHADQCGSRHLRMGVEHRFDLLGVERTFAGLHPVRLATAEPQPAVAVEVTEIAHAVDDMLRAACATLDDLGQARLRVAIEIAVGRGRAGDGDLADLALRQTQAVRPFTDGAVVDADDAHAVRCHRPADAGAGAPFGRFPRRLQFASLDQRDRQAFGGAVGRPEAGVGGQQLAQHRHHRGRHRRPGGHHPLHRRQRLAVAREHRHQRR